MPPPAPAPERDLEEADEERERGLGAAAQPSPPLRWARSWWCGDWVRRIDAMEGEVPKMALKPRLGDRGEVAVKWVGEWRGRDGICAPSPSPAYSESPIAMVAGVGGAGVGGGRVAAEPRSRRRGCRFTELALEKGGYYEGVCWVRRELREVIKRVI